MKFSAAQVVIGLPVPGPFDYLIPENLQDKVPIGSRVDVPFGAKSCVGYVVGLLAKSPFPRLKPLTAVLDNVPTLDEKFLKLTRELAEYYACSWGEAIEVALPRVLRSKKVVTWTPAFPNNKKSTTETLFFLGSLQACANAVAKKVKAVFSDGRGIVFLVPEVGQMAVAKDFLEKVCQIPVGILDRHSGVKQELADWLAIREGRTRIIVGTRSAVFAMMPDLGLIVMVDEENSAYKQEPSPFYHVREVALWRQRIEKCDLLFVSPAPTAELWKILKERKVPAEVFLDKHSGSLQAIDLTNYKYHNMLISFPLQNDLQATLGKGNKALLFLNRRGFSTLTKCNQCGCVLKCGRCNTPLSFLYSKRKMFCPKCSSTSEFLKFCPQCKGSYLRSMGTGIEKLESELARIYPQARMATFDSDTKNFSGEANVMIATQAIMPFLHRAAFALIAVLDFDGEINRVDFRASCRAFSLLTRLRQAAGEKLVVQTRNPQHEAIRFAAAMTPEIFYKGELSLRRELGLPPYSHMVALALRGTREEDVLDQAQKLYEHLNALSGKDFEISLPQPDLIPKLRDKFRFTIMLKGKAVKSILKQISGPRLEFAKRKGVVLTIDVNP